MLLAEAFVLLALDTDGSVAPCMTRTAAVGVTGALIYELVQEGHLEHTYGRIGLTGSKPDNPVLAQALENIRPHEGKKLKSRLAWIKHSGWREVVDAMVADGVLGREKEALRPTRHPVANTAAHSALLTQVRQAATGEGPIDPRIATLLALAGPCQMLEVVAPERSDRPAAKRRIAEATDQVPATVAVAVKHVIRCMTSG